MALHLVIVALCATLALSSTPSLSDSSSKALLPRAFPPNFQVKVLCVGDSITVGVGDGYPTGTQENNGYRLNLYNLLTNAGVNPQFIGSQISGTDNPQPHHEGYGSFFINSMLNALKASGALSQQPNLVLIHAGTNDNDYENVTDSTTLHSGTPTRLGNLIDYVLCQAPNAVVLVAEVIQNKNFDGAAQAITNEYNAAIPGVVAERYMKGYKVRVVDMSMIGGDQLGDALHPLPEAYQEMANRWYSAILGVPDSWWSTSSSGVNGALLEFCARDSVTFSPALDGNVVASGFHANNDVPDPPSQPNTTGYVFVPQWTDKNVIAIGTGLPGSGVLFADLDGDGRPDYIWANLTQGSEGTIYAWLNGGPGVWTALNNRNEVAFGWPGTSYVELADLTGDKKADLILVANGQFKIWQNGGLNGNDLLWNPLPNAENGLNYIFGNAAPFHYFADMTGDGRADLIVLNNTVLDLYINEGFHSDGSITWKQCRNIGSANGSVYFADFDGDGK